MDRVTIFMQVPDKHMKAVQSMLGHFPASEYFFVLLPLKTKLLTCEQVTKLLESVLQNANVNTEFPVLPG